jgi:hypothetical protein
MKVSSISKRHLVKLQVLWQQHAARDLSAGDPRLERLRWASQIVGRKISSFKDLTSREANSCISALNGALGLPLNSNERQRSRQRGTQGRKNSGNVVTLATTEDFQRIESAKHRLGWTQEQLDAWLRSPSSPLGKRFQIRTQSDANRVWWAMKRLLKRAGKWEERSA